MKNVRLRGILLIHAVLALTCIAGWAFKAHCLVDGIWWKSVQYTTGCYSDAIPFWGMRGVASGQIPYLQTPLEYPVFTGALIWIEGLVTRALFGADAIATHFLGVVTLANALLALLVLDMLKDAGMPEKRLWAWAASPLLLLYVGHNWDMLAVAFAAGALVFARQDRLHAAAAMAGLGAAAKLFPALLVPLLCLQAYHRAPGAGWRKLAAPAGIAAVAFAAWAAVNLPVAYRAFDGWAEFYQFSASRSGTAASIWEILGTYGLFASSIAERNGMAFILFLWGCIALMAAGWQNHRDHAWTLFPPVLALFLLTNKVYSPQFDLWLYPFLLLTVRPAAPVAIFVIGSFMAYFSEMWWFAGQENAWPSAGYAAIAAAAAVRGCALVWVIADAMRNPPPVWIRSGLPDPGLATGGQAASSTASSP